MNLNYIIDTFILTLKGVPVSISIMLVSLILAFLPSLFLAYAQINKTFGVNAFATIYLAIIRATPLIVLILFFYSLIPSLLNQFFKSIGSTINIFEVNPIIYAYIIFTLISIGTMTEILRAGILTVNKGQIEAGESIGLTSNQINRRIVLPQALRNAIPNLGNLAINLVKGTSLVFVMTVQDITAIAKTEAAYGYNYIESYLVIFVQYIIICGLIQKLFDYLEERINRKYSN